MTRDQLQAKLTEMRQQETYLASEVDRLSEQLIMTRGAVQLLEHLLTQEAAESASPAPATNHQPVIEQEA